VDPVADLGPEHVVDEPVLGDPGKVTERRSGYDGVEMVTVPGDLGAGTRDPGFNALLELLGSCRHSLKGSGMPWLYFLKQ
jgi:hypothetical protein